MTNVADTNAPARRPIDDVPEILRDALAAVERLAGVGASLAHEAGARGDAEAVAELASDARGALLAAIGVVDGEVSRG
jgi:hypothetical protein